MRQKPVFHTVESKNVSYFILWCTATFISMIFLMLSLFFVMDYIVSLSGSTIILCSIIIISILNTIVCEIKRYFLARSEKAYNKVIINNEGIIFSNTYNLEIIGKILWTDIQPQPEKEFDIDIYVRIRATRARKITPHLLWKLYESEDSKIPYWSSEKFGRMFIMFVNKAGLFKAFFTGIATFRPDITVNPKIYTWYRLNPVSFEADYSSIKKEDQITFLIIIAIIIGCLIATYLIIIIFSHHDKINI